MKNTVGEVWKFLDSNPSIRRDLLLGLINQRALAKYILKQKKMNTTLDSIISAIRRYEVSGKEDVFAFANKLLEKMINLSTRSGLAEITLFKDDDVQKLLPSLFDEIEYRKGEVLRVIQANESIRIILDEKNLDRILRIFPDNKVIKIQENLAEINMCMNAKMQNTQGILALITNELAINGINIIEIMSSFPEMLFFFKEDDIINAHKVIYQLCHPN